VSAGKPFEGEVYAAAVITGETIAADTIVITGEMIAADIITSATIVDAIPPSSRLGGRPKPDPPEGIGSAAYVDGLWRGLYRLWLTGRRVDFVMQGRYWG
jgi:hypothetical protein